MKIKRTDIFCFEYLNCRLFKNWFWFFQTMPFSTSLNLEITWVTDGEKKNFYNVISSFLSTDWMILKFPPAKIHTPF
jgi:hypothetical protein